MGCVGFLCIGLLKHWLNISTLFWGSQFEHVGKCLKVWQSTNQQIHFFSPWLCNFKHVSWSCALNIAFFISKTCVFVSVCACLCLCWGLGASVTLDSWNPFSPWILPSLLLLLLFFSFVAHLECDYRMWSFTDGGLDLNSSFTGDPVDPNWLFGCLLNLPRDLTDYQIL